MIQHADPESIFADHAKTCPDAGIEFTLPASPTPPRSPKIKVVTLVT